MSEIEQDDLIDLTGRCPFCGQNFNSEKHDYPICMREGYKLIIKAQADYQKINERFDIETGEERISKWKRLKNFLFYDVSDFGKMFKVYFEIGALLLIILALEKFIRQGF